ncbi:MAG: glycoside hydrolase family 2 TIM barrel-domain containing protein [Rikenellaceae bacterium]
MKKLRLLSCLLCLVTFSANAHYTPDENFDKGWQFYKGVAQGAESPSFDDSKWRTLNLPHDWAIEGPFSVENDCRIGALPVSGTGWYRKEFTMSPSDKDKVVRIEFEGAMSHATVWVNGEQVGFRPYGYIGYEYDITEQLKFDGSENVIAVRLEPKNHSSRWYPGAGIHRSVWLKIDEPIYVDLYGVYNTSPTVTKPLAVAQNETVIVNKTNQNSVVDVLHEYYSPDGVMVASTEDQITIEPNSKGLSQTYTNIVNPQIWSMETPNIYTIKTTVSTNGKVSDTFNSRLGLRAITYDAEGFYINGERVQLQGVNIHHDNGALGAAVYRRADERKLEIMKDMGVNAIRASHNPTSREFLELCDSMGIVVIAEAYDSWAIGKVENGYNIMFDEWYERDLVDMIKRDRNHPSVIMWSIGNEIKEQWQPHGWKIAKELHEICKRVDPTRPTTAGFNSGFIAADNNMYQQVDIAGVNYKGGIYDQLRAKYPQMPVYGSETAGMTNSRGVYFYPIRKMGKHPSLQVTSYELVGPHWTYPPDLEFYFLKNTPSILGEFIWTGMDYLGETSPYGGEDNVTGDRDWNSDYPSRSSYFGAVDMAGFPKDRFYSYQAEWRDEPMVHLMPHWNWCDVKDDFGEKITNIEVNCMTNCESAELFLNGKSLGRKVMGKDLTRMIIETRFYEGGKLTHFDSPYRLAWDVPYEAGELKVIAYNGETQVVQEVIRTAGKPAKITLDADRAVIDADGKDLSYVAVRIEDKDGNLCPWADNRVQFTLEGEGVILATDNGDATSIEPFQQNDRKAFNGKALAIIRSNCASGTITLKATSKGLKSAEVEITTK